MPHRIKAYIVRYWLRLISAQISLPQRMDYFIATTRLIFSRLDPATIRVLLAAASVGWAVGAFPWFGFHPFRRHGYEVLAVMAPSWVWASLFLLHAIGVTWRFYERKEREGWHLFINVYGFVLWFSTTLAINFAIGTYTPTTGMEWTMVFASAWALMLTGKRKEVVTL